MVWSIEMGGSCRIVTHFNNGATTAHLATKYSHSKKAIQNLLSYYEEYDKVPQKGKRPRRRIGENSNITVEHRSILDNIFDEDPSYYIREARDLLNQRTGKQYSTAAVIKGIEDLGLNLKKVSSSPIALRLFIMSAAGVRRQRAR